MVVTLLVCGTHAHASNPADINNDGKVDFLDLAIVAENWLWIAPPQDMVLIPAGEFDMGDHYGVGDSDEKPVHTVYVDSFYMSKYEITNSQFCDFLNSVDVKVVSGVVYASSDSTNSYPYLKTYSSITDSQITYSGASFNVRSRDGYSMADHPVVEVRWFGAAAYCNWRSTQEKYQELYDPCDPNWPCDFTKLGYRLPTEAEWEYAARGGCHDPYYEYPWCANSIDCSKANFWPYPAAACNPLGLSDYPFTSPVGSYSANNYGLFDMAGNVWELCNDWYDSNYYMWCKNTCGEPCPNPTGPDSGSSPVLRGGSWNYVANYCRVAGRESDGCPDCRGFCRGFRVVLSD